MEIDNGPILGAPSTQPIVTTGTISNITTTTAECINNNLDGIGGDGVTSWGVCWSTSFYPTITDPLTQESGPFVVGAIPDSTMTGLTSDETYHVRTYAINSSGPGYGSDVEFTTSKTPAITRALNIGGKTMTFGGKRIIKSPKS